MKCPYNDMDCRYVDTLDMTQEVTCTECECFDPDGIRAIGGCHAKAWAICFGVCAVIWGLIWLLFVR